MIKKFPKSLDNSKFVAKTASEAYGLLTQAYGEHVLGQTTYFEWFKSIKNGRTSTEDDERARRARRPSTSVCAEKIEEIQQIIMQDRRMTMREISEETEISLGTVLTAHSNRRFVDDTYCFKICASSF